jgi:hypothetical protein
VLKVGHGAIDGDFEDLALAQVQVKTTQILP